MSLAHESMARPRALGERVEALLAWSRHAEPQAADAMLAEALELVATNPSTLGTALRGLPEPRWAAHEATLRGWVEAETHGPGTASNRRVLIGRTPLERRHDDVERLLRLPLDLEQQRQTLIALLPLLPFAWVEARALAEVSKPMTISASRTFARGPELRARLEPARAG